MGGLAAQLLTPPSLPSLLAGLTRRWTRGRHPPGGGAIDPPKDPLLITGQQLRDAREAQGLGLRDLAQQTRISTAVLEALERGWRDRLPEPAYLRTMLPLLEQRLQLTPGSLGAALPTVASNAVAARREKLRQRFTPGSIEVFTSWQGTLLYGLLGLVLLYGLNLSQRRLIEHGLQTTGPLPAQATTTSPEINQGLLAGAYQDVLPLRSAASGRALRQWRQESQQAGVDLSLGWLSIRLNGPTRLQLKDSEGRRTTLEGVQGELTLPVLPPFELNLNPAAPALAVRWNGLALSPDPTEAGRYRYPPAIPPQGPRSGLSKAPKLPSEGPDQLEPPGAEDPAPAAPERP
ncbi:MAG: helix-turn-helix transcriptional regulator [Cyanobacteria bacterium]|nr:helix-turn-helix transcriptional regulator [Cyanobacteriota bacterium]